MHFAKVLKRLYKESGGQAAMGAVAGVSQPVLCRYASGAVTPSREALGKIFAAAPPTFRKEMLEGIRRDAMGSAPVGVMSILAAPGLGDRLSGSGSLCAFLEKLDALVPEPSNPDFQAVLPAVLRRALKKNGGQTKIAARSGIPQSSLSRFAGGKNKPSPSAVADILAALPAADKESVYAAWMRDRIQAEYQGLMEKPSSREGRAAAAAERISTEEGGIFLKKLEQFLQCNQTTKKNMKKNTKEATFFRALTRPQIELLTKGYGVRDLAALKKRVQQGQLSVRELKYTLEAEQ